MTHITEARVVGSHAEMAGTSEGNAHGPLTVFEVLRDGVRRRTRRAEAVAAQSTWDSEGGATVGAAY
jgi:hypothetical protein